MRISCQSFSMPKAGRNFANCEDAYFPYNVQNLEIFENTLDKCDVFRCAVSDGATDSIFSGLWAQMLAQGYGSGKWGAEISAQSIQDEQNAWHEFLANQQLPWYAEEKAEMGAFAATVGLTIYENSNQWQALAIGDCCIFQIRDGECISAFPIDNSAGFSNFPLLLCSVAARNNEVFGSKKVIPNGTWQSGDQFLLMSDTVACWFLSAIESGCGSQAIEAFNSIRSLDDFTTMMVHARTGAGADGIPPMRDDDITVSIVTVADGASPPFKRRLNTAIRSSAAATGPTTASTPGGGVNSQIAQRAGVELPNVPRKPVNAQPVDPSLSTGYNAALKQTPDGIPAPGAKSVRTSSTTLPPARKSSDSYDDDDFSDSEYPAKSFIGQRKFAQSKQHASGTNKGPAVIAAALVLGAGAAGYVWFSKPKPSTQPTRVKNEAVLAPQVEPPRAEESTVKEGKHHRRHRSGTPNAVTPASRVPTSQGSSANSAQPGATTGERPRSKQSSSSASQMPAAAPSYARPREGGDSLPATAPSRSTGRGLPTVDDAPAANSPGMPPKAPSRSTGSDRDHLPGLRPSRKAPDLTPITASPDHRPDGGDTPVKFSQ